MPEREEFIPMGRKSVANILTAATTTQTSKICYPDKGSHSLSASISGTGAVSATVLWYGANNAEALSQNAELLATSTLFGTTTDYTAADVDAEFPVYFCKLTAISGTNAAVTAQVGG